MYVRYAPAPEAQALYNINGAALRHYASQVSTALASMQRVDTEKLDLGALLQLPGVVTPGPVVAEDGPLVQLVSRAVESALDALEQALAAGETSFGTAPTVKREQDKTIWEITLELDPVEEQRRARVGEIGRGDAAGVGPLLVHADRTVGFVVDHDHLQSLVPRGNLLVKRILDVQRDAVCVPRLILPAVRRAIDLQLLPALAER